VLFNSDGSFESWAWYNSSQKQFFLSKTDRKQRQKGSQWPQKNLTSAIIWQQIINFWSWIIIGYQASDIGQRMISPHLRYLHIFNKVWTWITYGSAEKSVQNSWKHRTYDKILPAMSLNGLSSRSYAHIRSDFSLKVSKYCRSPGDPKVRTGEVLRLPCWPQELLGLTRWLEVGNRCILTRPPCRSQSAIYTYDLHIFRHYIKDATGSRYKKNSSADRY